MKHLFALLLIMTLSHTLSAQSPFDTTGGRFRVPLFDSVQVISNVLYSRSVNSNGQLQNLVMDVYQPYADAEPQRPVMVLVHGGSFIQGNKLDLALTCKHFAQKGYVTVSIQYRLGYTSFTPVGAVQTVIRATQDLKNAIRFLRKSASLSNPYKINPDYVFAGGVSAGSITALHAAYMDELSEILPGQNIPSLDSLHNSGQLPGFDWRFKAVINIAGGVGDTNWIRPDDLPVTSFHGTADATVSYETGTFGGAFTLYGSHPIFKRAQNLGIVSELRPFPGAGHDYSIGNPGAADTTELRISRFLFPFLLPEITALEVPISTPKTELQWSPDGWKITSSQKWDRLQVFDLQGKLLMSSWLDAHPIRISMHGSTQIVRLSSSVNFKSFLLPGRAN